MTRNDRALATLARLPRTRLGSFPTPLQEASNLRAAVAPDGPTIRLKRDDETGFALGGNKVRKLEMELAPERLRDVTHLITTGGTQSNHARVTAAAAARLGLHCILVLDGEPPDPPRGNALLHRLFGARIQAVSSREEREEAMEAAAREVADAGGRALVVPLGSSTPLGALGYADAAREMDEQMATRSPPGRPGLIHIVVASSSCGTLAGLAAGFVLLGRSDVRLMGVSADVPRDYLVERSAALATEALARLGVKDPVPDQLIEGTDAEVGPGYGLPTPEARAATELLARTEGVVLDPVYTSKAAAGMLRLLAEGRMISPEDEVVFWHTGGHPALLA